MKTSTQTAKHTPGSWKVLADCQRERGNPFDAARFIATANAEWSGDNRDGSDYLMSGELICSTRDGENQDTNARLIAAAPDLLAALQEITAQHDAMLETFKSGFGWGRLVSDKARAAIARATQST